MIIPLALFFLCLAGSAFFSGMEAALFSLSRFRVKTLVFENRSGARTVEALRRNSGRTLAAILLGNLLVNIGASSIAAVVTMRIIASRGYDHTLTFVVENVVMGSILLIVGEITPKVIAVANREALALRFGTVLKIALAPLNPIAAVFDALVHRAMGRRAPRAASDEDIRFMINEAKQAGVLDESEEQLAQRILRFGSIRVREIMVPRERVVTVTCDLSLDGARAVIARVRHSRLPVLHEQGVQGVLYAKDLLPQVRKPGARVVSDVMRPAFFIADSKPVDELLTEFRRKGIHFAVVGDTPGGFVGVVALDDVLEALLGTIKDESP